jgi:hypothetical protein
MNVGVTTDVQDLIGYCAEQFSPYKVGARLWCKETWGLPHNAIAREELDRHDVIYKASQTEQDLRDMVTYGLSWRSPVAMPRWASRLTLEVTAVGIIRLQDVNELDATSLSIRDAVRQFTEMQMELWCKYTKILDPQASVTNNRAAVGVVWDSKHKGTDLAWEHSPWVWAVDYTVVEKGDSKNGQSD